MQLRPQQAKAMQLDGESIPKPPLNVTLRGKECQLTVNEVGTMTPVRFKRLWMVRAKCCSQLQVLPRE